MATPETKRAALLKSYVRIYEKTDNNDLRRDLLPVMVNAMGQDDQYEFMLYMKLSREEKDAVLKYDAEQIKLEITDEVKRLAKHLKETHPKIYRTETEKRRNDELDIFDWCKAFWNVYFDNGLYNELISIIV